MNLQRWRFSPDYAGGDFGTGISTTKIDTSLFVTANTYYHPTIIPGFTAAMPVVTRTTPGNGSTNEVQTISFAGVPTGSVFTFGFRGNATQILTYTSGLTAASLQTSARALPSINGVNINITGSNGGPYTCTFVGTLTHLALPTIVLDVLTGQALISLNGVSGNGGSATTANGLGFSVGLAALETFAVTSQYGDYIQWVTTSPQVAIGFAGLWTANLDSYPNQAAPGTPAGGTSNLYLGGGGRAGDTGFVASPIRNGCIVNVYVDTFVTPVATVDLWQGTPTQMLYLDGTSHTIRVQHSGTANVNNKYFGNLIATVGATVFAGTSLAASLAASSISALWRVVALSSSTYRLDKAPPLTPAQQAAGTAPSYSVIQATLNVGTTYPGDATHVPGVALLVSGTLTTTHAATFTTDLLMMGVQAFSFQTGVGSNFGTYRSQVFDTGDLQTQYYNAEWAQNVNMSTFSLNTGNTPVVDGSWSTYGLTPTQNIDSIGQNNGYIGLQPAVRGRYYQWVMTMARVVTVIPWFRDVKLFYWNPQNNPQIMDKYAFGLQWTPGPIMQALTGVQGVIYAASRARALDLKQSYAISQSIDQYLAAYGADLGFTQYTGEQPQSYQARITSASQSRSLGGSPYFICQQEAELALGAPLSNAIVVSTASTGLQTATYSATISAIAYTVTVAQTGSKQYTITINTSGSFVYPGLPALAAALAQTILTQHAAGPLRPVGSVFQPNNGASYNITFS